MAAVKPAGGYYVRVMMDYKHGELDSKDDSPLAESVMKALSDFWGLPADKIKLHRPGQPMSRTAVDCTLHLNVQAESDEPFQRLLSEIAQPFSELKTNRHLAKCTTIDIKNNTTQDVAYQEVLGMIAERDLLLFEKDMAMMNFFSAKNAAETSRLKALGAEMEVEYARSALLSRKIQLAALDPEQAAGVQDELQKVTDKLKDMIKAASTLAETTNKQFLELDELQKAAAKASKRYSDFSAEFSSACFRAIESGRAGHWQGELQRHHATEHRYGIAGADVTSSYYDAYVKTRQASAAPKQLSGGDYVCAFGCGYKGLYHEVAKHELTCPMCPQVSSDASQLAPAAHSKP